MKNKLKIILLFFLISCGSKESLLEGSWTVVSVYMNGTDISGIDKSGGSYVANTMIFQDNIFQLPVKEKLTAKFRLIRRGGHELIEVYESLDGRFNGLYLFEIKLLKQYNNGANKLYQLEMQSDEIYILGKKMIVELV
ncbi:hypothetical protein SAMN05421640_2487 [Ekhidna lutea]|uniref:Uncharacterized protein n=1 Tax=Ekhidna lutea TaxID=447679 RepID=A0A239K9A1_EKHLU|nr:hypothetical protein [Ekhidna lutea]SNT14242.1 hypothetical protein SAMN05421640_2487 [Ekhidna lutea]